MSTRPRFETRAAPLWIVALLGGILAVTPLATASGSGYDLSYSRSAGSTSVSSVDLVSVETNDPGGNNITVSFAVSGGIDVSSSDVFYWAWFGGTTSSNSTAWVVISNSTNATYYSASGSGESVGQLIVSVSPVSTVTFSLAKSVVGPASTFGVNVEAAYESGSSYAVSWLGTDFSSSGSGSGSGGGGGGGGGGCTGTTCTGSPSTSSSSSSGISSWVVLGSVAAVIVVALLVVLLVVLPRMRAKPPVPPAPRYPGYPGQPAPTPPPGGSPLPPPGSMPPPPPSHPPGAG